MATDPHSDALLSHGESLRRLAQGLVGEDGAADLVQEAYAAALKSRTPLARVSGFLATVVRRRAVDRLRRRPEESTPVPEPTSPSTDDSVARLELVQIIVEELRSLPASQRDAIERRYFDEQSPAEIARHLGVAPATVRAHLTRGLESLRARLDRRVGERREWLSVLVPWVSSPSTSFLLAGLMNSKLLVAASVVIVVSLGALWSSQRAEADEDQAVAQVTDPEPVDGAVVGETGLLVPGSGPERHSESLSSTEPRGSVVRGQVVDKRTGEPVPFLRVLAVQGVGSEPVDFEALRQSGELLEVTTDELGLFVSAQRWPDGPVRMWTLDDHWQAKPRAVEGPLFHPIADAIPAAVGPTFRFDLLDVPAEVRDRLFVTFEGPGLQAAEPELDHPAQGDWVRFSPRVPELTGAGPWTLTAQDPDGFYFGKASVTRRQGIEPAVVLLDGQSTGVVEIDWSEMVGESAQPKIARLQVDSEPRLAPFGFAPEENVARFPFVPAGTFTWSAGDQTGEVTVRTGEVSRVRIERRPGQETFSVVVSFDLAQAPEADLRRTELILLPGGDFTAAREVRPSQENGRWLASFDGLTPGDWQVLVQNSVHNDYRLEPDTLGVSPEAPEAHFVVVPRGEVVYGVLELVDRQGDPIADCLVEWQDEAGERQVVTTNGEGLAHRSLEVGRPSLLIAHASGYQAQVVAFTPTSVERKVRVTLDPGWRSLVRVMRLPNEPAAGVEVLADGRSIGRTEELGYLYVEGEGPPDTLTLGPDAPAVKFTTWGQPQAGPDPHAGWTFLVE